MVKLVKFIIFGAQEKYFTIKQPTNVRIKKLIGLPEIKHHHKHPWAENDSYLGYLKVTCNGDFSGMDLKDQIGDELEKCKKFADEAKEKLSRVLPINNEIVQDLIYECKDKVSRYFALCEEEKNLIAQINEVKDVLAQIIKKNQTLTQHKYQIAGPATREHDLRNLMGRNFRGWYEDISSDNHNVRDAALFLGEEANLANKVSPSRSYVMKKDFMFSDTMAVAHPDSIFTNDIQPLILNEFQPKETITPADLLGPLLDSIIGTLTKFAGMFIQTGVKVGGKYITNSLIDKYSHNTSLLYCDPEFTNQKRYFTKDPVQMVVNMFAQRRRKMVEHI